MINLIYEISIISNQVDGYLNSRLPKIWLNIKYTTIHAIQKYGPVAQPGRVPDFYHIERNPAVSGSNPDGPAIKLVLKKDSRT